MYITAGKYFGGNKDDLHLCNRNVNPDSEIRLISENDCKVLYGSQRFNE